MVPRRGFGPVKLTLASTTSIVGHALLFQFSAPLLLTGSHPLSGSSCTLLILPVTIVSFEAILHDLSVCGVAITSDGGVIRPLEPNDSVDCPVQDDERHRQLQSWQRHPKVWRFHRSILFWTWV